jgi:hypothetical protein
MGLACVLLLFSLMPVVEAVHGQLPLNLTGLQHAIFFCLCRQTLNAATRRTRQTGNSF